MTYKLNIKLIEDRLGFIVKALSRLEKLSRLGREEFLSEDNPAIAESYLRRALEAIFDTGRHILAKKEGQGIVEYKEIARTLGRKGIISKECSESLVLMAGYRNRLVHFYHEVEDAELYEILQANLTDIRRFLRDIKDFLIEYKKTQKDI
jgi:uncharacterized protein YutE (UPF0331/DUF86 family)